MALTFFMAAFTGPNNRNIGRQSLIDTLDDVLFGLRDSLGEDKFPRAASEYLDDWAAPERAWLRKYYIPGQDEPVYDLTATAEDVVRWVENLRGRSFVATQSRLTSIFVLLKTLVQQSKTDPEVRLSELQKQRDAIDAEMLQIRDGNIKVMSGPEAQDHFQQLTALAKDLLSDFREVEQNFRALDRQVREQIATWDGTQGELLEHILSNQQGISSSVQGRTFQGFWDYLMSPQLQTELRDLLERATQIDALARLDNLHSITNLHQDWLPAVEQTQTTVRQLSQQMRRLLDDKVFLENKRIMQLIRGWPARLGRVTESQLAGVGGSDNLGGLLEGFVTSELLKQRTWGEEEFNLFHFRDRTGIEVDLIVEYADGAILALEVKSSSSFNSRQFKGPKFLRDQLGDRFIGGVVLNTNQDSYRFADKLWGLPVASLWEAIA